ncbi:MAG: hypothetical protein QOH28_3098 [Actinomycetota bacterium]|nr:hypothetical protein [Actinomycetota bacterium]
MAGAAATGSARTTRPQKTGDGKNTEGLFTDFRDSIFGLINSTSALGGLALLAALVMGGAWIGPVVSASSEMRSVRQRAEHDRAVRLTNHEQQHSSWQDAVASHDQAEWLRVTQAMHGRGGRRGCCAGGDLCRRDRRALADGPVPAGARGTRIHHSRRSSGCLHPELPQLVSAVAELPGVSRAGD